MDINSIETYIIKNLKLIDILKSLNADYLGNRNIDSISMYFFKLNNGDNLPIPFCIKFHKIKEEDYIRFEGQTIINFELYKGWDEDCILSYMWGGNSFKREKDKWDITDYDSPKLEQLLSKTFEHWKIKWDYVLEDYDNSYLKQLVEKALDINSIPLKKWVGFKQFQLDDEYLKNPKSVPNPNQPSKLPSPPSTAKQDMDKEDIKKFNKLAEDEIDLQGGGLLELIANDDDNTINYMINIIKNDIEDILKEENIESHEGDKFIRVLNRYGYGSVCRFIQKALNKKDITLDDIINPQNYKQSKYLLYGSDGDANVFINGYDNIFSILKKLRKDGWRDGNSLYDFIYNLIYKTESLKPMTMTEALKYLRKSR